MNTEFEEPGEDDVNPETIELIYQSEMGARAELLEDRHNIKRGAQQNLTTSAVLLGLLLNLAATPASTHWHPAVTVLLAIAAGILLVASIASVLHQQTAEHSTGYLDSTHLYNEFAFDQPTELRLEQLGNLIEVRQEIYEDLVLLSDKANQVRVKIVSAVVLIGAALLIDLCTRVLPGAKP